MALLDADRLFPLEDRARGIARALYDGARPSHRQPARPYRPALVRRGRGLPRPRAALRDARPLRLPHALLAGRAARGPRRAAHRRRPDRDRPARSGGASPRTTTCSAARPRGCGSTTPSPRSSGSRSGSRPTAPTASTTTSPTASRGPNTGPARCYERFGIEVIATTEARSTTCAGTAHDPRERLDRPRRHRLPPRCGRRSGVRGLCRQRRALGRAAGGRDHLGRLPRRPPHPPRLLQDVRRHQHRPRPPDRPDRGPRPAEAKALFAKALRGACTPGGGRRLPRPHADRDGADEPRRRARAADPPGQPSATTRPPSWPASAATRASTSRPAPTTSAR
jgi:hypothetical protein